ncbi:phosphoenolpyruvate--protein phosphotransferase [Martelella sp. AD-3]|uniref:phosphoenolpyruvate--protein phosphotransferase n=1 Tax=Martelella sp. AD-3 TaxID=686597 RepID=UPI0004B291E4|nr:phosphoenolpyruvate--protein phosphotransferase [Martelella sp. AD-3]
MGKSETAAQAWLERKASVRVSGGLHARPISEIIRIAKRYDAEVELATGVQQASARSSLKLLLLGVKEGDTITVRGRGDDADLAVDAVSAFLERGDTETHSPSAAPAASQAPAPTPEAASRKANTAPSPMDRAPLTGVPVCAGVALGSPFVFQQPKIAPEPAQIEPDSIAREQERARAALNAVSQRLREAAQMKANPSSVMVMEALADLSADEDWAEAIQRMIAEGDSALAAVEATAESTAQQIETLASDYARARAEDMRAAGHLVAMALQGKKPLSVGDVPAGSVLVAEELTAAHMGGEDLSHLAAIVAERGASNGHAAILARSFGIPTVFGLPGVVNAVKEARVIAVDGATGDVIVDPDDETSAHLRIAIAAAAEDREELERFTTVKPVTRDGVSIIVAANIGSVNDLDFATEAGAMGVGLMRTEFLFMDRAELPDEDEQYQVYRTVLERFPDDEVIIRTLDIGGDKPCRAIDLPKEDNPFLGLRGIRLCLAKPEIFRPQLRALLRAACHGRLKVMLPMIATGDEISETKALIESCEHELEREGKTYGPFELGIMVETPAAVFSADALAKKAAFFSLGTNDLTQYVMAADRTNPAVASLSRTQNPAVIEAVRLVCAAAARADIPVGVCGEAAADPVLSAVFLQAGVRELSVSAAAIRRVKRQVCALELKETTEQGV